MAKNGRAGPTAARPSHDDEVKFEKNGTVTIFEGGRGHHLMHPTVGQLRVYGADFTQLQEDQAAARAKEAETADSDDPFEYDDKVFTAQWLAWWRLVIEGDEHQGVAALDRDACPLPADDDGVPGWLLDGSLVSELFKVWRTVPWAGGSSPTQTEEAALMEKMRTAGPAVAPLLQALQGTGLGAAAGLTPTASGNAAPLQTSELA